ncbi:uncharacterized protein SPPG_09302 [Spizellomyces punctatus DAOM BR117]|uniref:Nucleoporin Nup159/Nup146 N-terminal domain-containing protein n=1 Tax=Spizellomyces punctatus (strain DAOM BR117) TaxID=645134 RepID=A0A0L0HC28_SPIPD|nr:uncharacterized protein SPPG_09302 [Spizellomyces punctatus DAOM BR117]KNC98742.1 hypothetical protein SPPG_09302 [Spizellomyces punctatus DAOM BR117]|eukprot:XP_016606782.1 hypothetical protein SPPG_09302 [Spizellomyces punctatus DAOM BR117]
MGSREGPAVEEVEGEPVAQTWLQFKPLQLDARLKVSDPLDVGDYPSLLAVSSRYGYAVFGTTKGYTFVRVKDVRASLNSAAKGSVVPIKNAVEVEIPDDVVTRIILDTTELMVIVYTRAGKILLYAVPGLLEGENRATSTFDLGSNVLDLRMNPGAFPKAAAALLEDGSVSLLTLEQDGKITRSPLVSDACSICWSQKGKQLACGLKDGSVVQVAPEGTITNTIPPPPALVSNYPVKVSSVQWLHKRMFAVIYQASQEDANEPSPLFIITQTPITTEGPLKTKYIQLDEPLFPDTDRKSQYFTEAIKSLCSDIPLLLAIANAYSTDIAFAGAADATSSQFGNFILEEGSGIMLPLDENEENTWVVGMGIDFTSDEPVPAPTPDRQPSPSVPILLVYTNAGELAAYHCLDVQAADKGDRCTTMRTVEALPTRDAAGAVGLAQSEGQSQSTEAKKLVTQGIRLPETGDLSSGTPTPKASSFGGFFQPQAQVQKGAPAQPAFTGFGTPPVPATSVDATKATAGFGFGNGRLGAPVTAEGSPGLTAKPAASDVSSGVTEKASSVKPASIGFGFPSASGFGTMTSAPQPASTGFGFPSASTGLGTTTTTTPTTTQPASAGFAFSSVSADGTVTPPATQPPSKVFAFPSASTGSGTATVTTPPASKGFGFPSASAGLGAITTTQQPGSTGLEFPSASLGQTPTTTTQKPGLTGFEFPSASSASTAATTQQPALGGFAFPPVSAGGNLTMSKQTAAAGLNKAGPTAPAPMVTSSKPATTFPAFSAAGASSASNILGGSKPTTSASTGGVFVPQMGDWTAKKSGEQKAESSAKNVSKQVHFATPPQSTAVSKTVELLDSDKIEIVHKKFEDLYKSFSAEMETFRKALQSSGQAVKTASQSAPDVDLSDPANWTMADLPTLLTDTHTIMKRIEVLRSEVEAAHKKETTLADGIPYDEALANECQRLIDMFNEQGGPDVIHDAPLGLEDQELKEKLWNRKRAVDRTLQQITNRLERLKIKDKRQASTQEIKGYDWATICQTTHRVTESTISTAHVLEHLEQSLAPLMSKLALTPARKSIPKPVTPRKGRAFGLYDSDSDSEENEKEIIVHVPATVFRRTRFHRIFKDVLQSSTSQLHINRRAFHDEKERRMKDPEAVEKARAAMVSPPKENEPTAPPQKFWDIIQKINMEMDFKEEESASPEVEEPDEKGTVSLKLEEAEDEESVDVAEEVEDVDQSPVPQESSPMFGQPSIVSRPKPETKLNQPASLFSIKPTTAGPSFGFTFPGGRAKEQTPSDTAESSGESLAEPAFAVETEEIASEDDDGVLQGEENEEDAAADEEDQNVGDRQPKVKDEIPLFKSFSILAEPPRPKVEVAEPQVSKRAREEPLSSTPEPELKDQRLLFGGLQKPVVPVTKAAFPSPVLDQTEANIGSTKPHQSLFGSAKTTFAPVTEPVEETPTPAPAEAHERRAVTPNPEGQEKKPLFGFLNAPGTGLESAGQNPATERGEQAEDQGNESQLQPEDQTEIEEAAEQVGEEEPKAAVTEAEVLDQQQEQVVDTEQSTEEQPTEGPAKEPTEVPVEETPQEPPSKQPTEEAIDKVAKSGAAEPAIKVSTEVPAATASPQTSQAEPAADTGTPAEEDGMEVEDGQLADAFGSGFGSLGGAASEKAASGFGAFGGLGQSTTSQKATTASSFGAGTAGQTGAFGGGFGTATTAAPAFGTGTTSQPSAFGGGFGTATTAAPAFGTGAASQPTAFGSTATTTPSAFGGGGFGVVTTTAPSAFGAGSATTSAPFGTGSGTGAFGANTTSTGGFGTGAFGSSQGFGQTSAWGTANSTAAPAFGQSTTTSNKPDESARAAFGGYFHGIGQRSDFGEITRNQSAMLASLQQQSGSGFSSYASRPSGFAAFAQQPQQQQSGFGQPSSGFGGGFTQAAPTDEAASIFGSQPSSGGFGSGGGPPAFGQAPQTNEAAALFGGGQPQQPASGFGSFGQQTQEAASLFGSAPSGGGFGSFGR